MAIYLLQEHGLVQTVGVSGLLPVLAGDQLSIKVTVTGPVVVMAGSYFSGVALR